MFCGLHEEDFARGAGGAPVGRRWGAGGASAAGRAGGEREFILLSEPTRPAIEGPRQRGAALACIIRRIAPRRPDSPPRHDVHVPAVSIRTKKGAPRRPCFPARPGTGRDYFRSTMILSNVPPSAKCVFCTLSQLPNTCSTLNVFSGLNSAACCFSTAASRGRR